MQLRQVLYYLAILAVSCVQGCTQRAWYEAFQTCQRYQCWKGAESDRDECLKLAQYKFENYQKDRKNTESEKYK